MKTMKCNENLFYSLASLNLFIYFYPAAKQHNFPLHQFMSHGLSPLTSKWAHLVTRFYFFFFFFLYHQVSWFETLWEFFSSYMFHQCYYRNLNSIHVCLIFYFVFFFNFHIRIKIVYIKCTKIMFCSVLFMYQDSVGLTSIRSYKNGYL